MSVAASMSNETTTTARMFSQKNLLLSSLKSVFINTKVSSIYYDFAFLCR